MNTAEAAVKTKWTIDTAHSEVHFKVKHLVISTVTGSFKKFSGNVEAESEDFNGAKIEFSIDTHSIDTNVADRDAHLKSADFFAAEQYPTLDFKKGKLSKVSGDAYKLNGELTIRDTTKPLTLDVTYGGQIVDPWGNTKAGFELKGKINRKDFGLTWSALTESGGLVVGDDVSLIINVEIAKA